MWETQTNYKFASFYLKRVGFLVLLFNALSYLHFINKAAELLKKYEDRARIRC